MEIETEPHQPMSPEDYLRAHSVIKTILALAGKDPSKECIFFSMAGAYILGESLGIQAEVRAGFFCLCTDYPYPRFTMTFGEARKEGLISHPGAFHAWIEANGYIIDLLSPLLGEATDTNGKRFGFKRRMFQKPKQAAKAKPMEIKVMGDFFVLNNPKLKQALVTGYISQPDIVDDLAKCSWWFDRSQEYGEDAQVLPDKAGIPRKVTLREEPLAGAW